SRGVPDGRRRSRVRGRRARAPRSAARAARHPRRDRDGDRSGHPRHLLMQRRHPIGHLFWRSGVAVISHLMMFTGLYPLVPHAVRRPRPAKAAFAEWAAARAVSIVRPAGFLPLPGARTHGPRPVIVLHGYAMNRANFVALAYRLKRAGLGPVLGFEYWA